MALFVEIERPERGYVVSTVREGGENASRMAFGEEDRDAAISYIESLLDQEDADRATAQGQSN